MVTLAALILCQHFLSFLRHRCNINTVVDNTPLLLMSGDQIIYDALKEARVTEDDLYAKLREANVLDFDEVRAVVLEATGDISVLDAEAGGKELNAKLLQGVRS